ncbi:helix-hairpin-helix domain-containing protein [Halalkalibacter krulwichiae]|uniref:ComE operon protein 1 n=1 Tax=Halalkalibacter krulwichiae TaxID=199441 RepID=A0A1X9M7A0_9BACI|nr:helix-hairpin-helix domain-containing protein [Halalkalibacter krulwichiae]ARK29299.1 ComE operon protein 1 [Halalkalibacter krulwichiae]
MKTIFRKKQLMTAVIIVFLVLIILFMHFRSAKEEVEVAHFYEQNQEFLNGGSEESMKVVEEVRDIVIDVKGAIARPGVYKLQEGDRIHQALEKAGGLLEGADETKLNFAQLLHDEMVVYVPLVGEEEGSVEVGNLTTPQGEENGKIPINRAEAGQLQQLPGIGPAKAAAIISYREEHGAFKDINDLLNISGIGPKSIEKLEEAISFH